MFGVGEVLRRGGACCVGGGGAFSDGTGGRSGPACSARRLAPAPRSPVKETLGLSRMEEESRSADVLEDGSRIRWRGWRAGCEALESIGMEAAFAAAWFNPPSVPKRATPIQSAVPLKVLRPSMAYAVFSVRACGPLRNHGPLSVNGLAASSPALRSPALRSPLLALRSFRALPAARPFGPHCCLRPSMGCGNRHPCRDYPPLPPGHPWPATARGRPYHSAGRSLRPSLRRLSSRLETSSLLQALALLAAPFRASGGCASMAFAHCTLPALRHPGSAGQRARLHGTAHPSPKTPRSNRPPIPRANNAGNNGNAPRARGKNGSPTSSATVVAAFGWTPLSAAVHTCVIA